MEYFILGLIAGYILYPLAKALNKYIAGAGANSGCTGNCLQGRRVCDCGGKQNGVS